MDKIRFTHTPDKTKYMQLDQCGQVMAEYVWIDARAILRSKTMTLDKRPTRVDDLEEWHFDGALTGQALAPDSDVLLRPVEYWRDPFRGGENIIVLTECWNTDGTPNKYNFRYRAASLSQTHDKNQTHFSIDQKFTLTDYQGRLYAWLSTLCSAPSGYCGVGSDRVFARDLLEAHYRACLYCRVPVAGIQAGDNLLQWEFRIGPAPGVVAADQLCFSRYLLLRVAEEFGIVVSFVGTISNRSYYGASAHTTVSTGAMRAEGGLEHIHAAIEELRTRHKEHMACYGDNNEHRREGRYAARSVEMFDSGVDDRRCAIRIPGNVAREGRGYFEDRRPSASMDPYRVVAQMLETLFS